MFRTESDVQRVNGHMERAQPLSQLKKLNQNQTQACSQIFRKNKNTKQYHIWARPQWFRNSCA